MNKRPTGTRILEENERKDMIRKLKKEKDALEKQIETISVTLYT